MKIKIILLCISAGLLIQQPVFAQLGSLDPPPAANADINTVIFNGLEFAIGSGIVVFLFMFVWGCLEWITSAGEKGHLEKAKHRITTAVIGLLILASAYAVFSIVKTITYDKNALNPATQPPGCNVQLNQLCQPGNGGSVCCYGTCKPLNGGQYYCQL